ncbi:hypothetical protein Taro_005088 [Colocasia esculenta]|uniref:Auxin response factor n=1 Tax=Colocasia esculenta TaxID=4460 RepID=A0A843TS22_COLES|nr:hypothetical protein [Colocasia esculenta]
MAAAEAAEKGRESLDPLIWKACAGSGVRIPPVGSLVYYFPQGHAEQASAAPDFSSVACDRSFFLCTLVNVQFLADPDTDEVFARMRLEPRISAPAPPPERSVVEDGEGKGDGVASFAKVLTPSDANNGGGFSVPRFCADSIFPPLDYSDDPPVQSLKILDVHSTQWDFRHIYRGTPRRHLLTTGWSNFVNGKKLVAGDSVVFIKNKFEELFVGVRRTARSGGPLDISGYSAKPLIDPPTPFSRAAKRGANSGSGEGFSRNCRGRVLPEAVVEATTLAGLDHPFEVVYYPRVGSPEFVVRKEVVEAALRVPWSTGTRVKMAMETVDSSRITSFQGTVSCIVQHSPPFSYSPWRTLEVTWDEADVFQTVKRVSPWQLELVSATPQILTPYPAMKKPRTAQNQELLSDGAGPSTFFRMSDFSTMVMESMSPPIFSHNIFPAGMQGARHNPMCVSSLSNFLPDITLRMYPEKLNSNNSLPTTSHVSTELSIGCASQSGSLSPPSQNSIYYYGSELFGNAAVNNSSNVMNSSLRLFGTTIHIGQPVIADDKEGCNNNAVSVRPYSISFPYPQRQFHDDPPQGLPFVET